MTVLTIRVSKRFATRQPVSLEIAGQRAVDGLLVEVSAEGCRISHLGDTLLAIGQPVTIATDVEELRGRIRWSREGVAGIRLDAALHTGELIRLLGRAGGSPLRFGT